MARSLNKVQIIGNMTHDPELRYTPQGSAVCSFTVATNRQWTTDTGEKKEEAEFHRVVAWNKLAEICGQYLSKGRKVYIEGRLQTREWETQDGQKRQTTEIVANEMLILDSKSGDTSSSDFDISDEAIETFDVPGEENQDTSKSKVKSNDANNSDKAEESEDDIPF